LLLKQDGKITWHVRSKPPAAQTGIVEFRYGEEPSGFETVIPPETLQRSVDYTLHVTGIAHGAFRFRMDSGPVRVRCISAHSLPQKNARDGIPTLAD
jgi:hypothetical protein